MTTRNNDAATSGRIVMLVDNGVHGDSRVQKSAQSAAEAGWEVVLLGRSPNNQPQAWTIGSAQVRTLSMPSPLRTARSEYRRAWLRRPFAYPPTGIAAHRQQSVRAWRADLDVRRAVATIDASTGRGGTIGRRALDARFLAARTVGRWVAFRSRQLTAVQEARRRHAGPVDRVTARLDTAIWGVRAWRRLLPELWDYELAYGKVIDGLKPDIIHANDYRMLGVGVRAAIRGRASGRDVKVVWDAHEFLPGVHPLGNARWLPGNIAHEREYAPRADAVVTVSDSLAELLQQTHRLAQRPTVVLNAPTVDAPPVDAEPVPDLRLLCGVSSDTPLIVYSGLAARKRGLSIMVEALPRLDRAHVALVVQRSDAPDIEELRVRAAELGVADRLHILPYVPYQQVVAFLSGADVGVIPIHHVPNHEIALITKFFEYSHARLPIVVSDVRTMAETVRATGQGVVFRAEDVDDYVRAVRDVLADPQPYRDAYEKPGLLAKWTWAAQAEILDGVYHRVLAGRTRPA